MAFSSFFSGPVTLFCSTNELTSCKAATYGAPFVKVFRMDYSEPRLAGGGAI